MEFKMNGRTYEIKEVSQEKMLEENGEVNGKYFGLTIPDKQEIWLWEKLSSEQKRKTLCHELMHCYIFNFITFNDVEISEDAWADVSANSHDIIHEIVEEYFRNK